MPINLEITYRRFSFFGSSVAHLEPELELFDVSDDDGEDDLSKVTQTAKNPALQKLTDCL